MYKIQNNNYMYYRPRKFSKIPCVLHIIEYGDEEIYFYLNLFSCFALENIYQCYRMSAILSSLFSWVLSLLRRYFYKVYIVKMFEIVLSFNVKDNNIFPCFHNIRLSYNM